MGGDHSAPVPILSGIVLLVHYLLILRFVRCTKLLGPAVLEFVTMVVRWLFVC